MSLPVAILGFLTWLSSAGGLDFSLTLLTLGDTAAWGPLPDLVVRLMPEKCDVTIMTPMYFVENVSKLM